VKAGRTGHARDDARPGDQGVTGQRHGKGTATIAADDIMIAAAALRGHLSVL
jgi:hypothetical protein